MGLNLRNDDFDNNLFFIIQKYVSLKINIDVFFFDIRKSLQTFPNLMNRLFTP